MYLWHAPDYVFANIEVLLCKTTKTSSGGGQGSFLRQKAVFTLTRKNMFSEPMRAITWQHKTIGHERT